MSDKFKFSEDQIKQVKHLADRISTHMVSSYDHIVSELESIIQDRGNSIQDGWIDVEEKPNHNQQVMTYTPHSDITEEEYRLIRYGSQLSGFPIGVTKWQPLPSAPKQPKK